MSWMSILLGFWWLLLPIALLAVGALGLIIDSEHRKSLKYRRAEVGHVLVTDLRQLPGMDVSAGTQIVSGEVVLAANRLISTLARFKLFFGGEVKTFHETATRARQEAMIRLMEQAASLGYDAVGNVRVEPVDLAGVTTRDRNQQGKGVSVAIIAYGMAYRRTADFPTPAAAPTVMGYLT
ncbi:MAG: heavy metal-binding domain-containing protein [Planctomycetota bacterium]